METNLLAKNREIKKRFSLTIGELTNTGKNKKLGKVWELRGLLKNRRSFSGRLK